MRDNILATENQQAIINDVIEVKAGVYLYKTQTNMVKDSKEHAEKAIYSAEHMLGYVRSEAIGKPMLFDENAAFVVMRFSQNDENDHAYLYGIKPALEKLKVKCIRADNQITITI